MLQALDSLDTSVGFIIPAYGLCVWGRGGVMVLISFFFFLIFKQLYIWSFVKSLSFWSALVDKLDFFTIKLQEKKQTNESKERPRWAVKSRDVFKRKDSPLTSVDLGLFITFIYLKVRNVNLGAYVQTFCPACVGNIHSSFQGHVILARHQSARG